MTLSGGGLGPLRSAETVGEEENLHGTGLGITSETRGGSRRASIWAMSGEEEEMRRPQAARKVGTPRSGPDVPARKVGTPRSGPDVPAWAGCFLAAVLVTLASQAGASVAGDILALTGQRTRVVWIRGTNGQGDFMVGSPPGIYQLVVFDTAVGTDRVLDPGPDAFKQPLISPDGSEGLLLLYLHGQGLRHQLGRHGQGGVLRRIRLRRLAGPADERRLGHRRRGES